MRRAENHLILIDGARNCAEKSIQLQIAINDATGCEYEDYNEQLGMTIECIIALFYSDGSELIRIGKSVLGDGAWIARGV